MPIFLASGIVGFILVVLFIIFYVIACISVERTKNETIRIRELLENINKIEIARYKKESSAAEPNKQTEE